MSTPSSSTSSAGSPSSGLEDTLKIDLSLDDMSFGDPRSDPLEFLLQSISTSPDSNDSSSSSSSSQANSPPEWPQMSAWPAPETKLSDLGSDFDFAFPMDLEFNPNPAVDPSSLHFNTSMFSQPSTGIVPDNEFLINTNTMTDDVISSSMFSFDPPTPWTPQPPQPLNRRLSITSSSSSSGASLSPVIEHRSSTSSASSDNGRQEIDPAYELAQRVRQIAGVTLAVPVSAQVQQMAAAGGQAKLPIPRLPRSNPIIAPSKRVTIKPPPSPEPSFSPSASPPSESPDSFSSSNSQSSQPTASTGRAKTSHTTIERRYRTNLNARITGLKQAVPALRVLEPRSASEGYRDVVDSRGFVDGVKVARKMSKANILGKATEYIRVLKKREIRLKREQDGLKSLIAGLVGGPALLKEWEREWRDKFGGEEKDEVEDDNLAAGSDDEDGDGDDSDGEDEEGRARKKLKVSKPIKKEKVSKPLSAPLMPTGPGAVPEKRKRGRPRKNPLPPAVPASLQPSPQLTFSQDQMPGQHNPQAHHGQPVPQYLLAAFAFFSVFNSPIAKSYSAGHSYAHTHMHHGTVLTKVPTPQPSAPTPNFIVYGYGLHDIVQAFHLLVSTLVLFYVIIPWITGLMRQNSLTSTILTRITAIFDPTLAKVGPAPPVVPEVFQDNAKVVARTRKALTDALASERRGAPDEAAQLRTALGVSTGLMGLLQGVIKAVRIDRGIEVNQLAQRAWVRLGETIAFDPNTPKTTRLQTYWCMSWHISPFSASPAELSTLALIIRPLSGAKAATLWDQARARDVLRPYEKLVLTTMSIDDAAEWLAKWRLWHDTEVKGRCAACEKRTPLGVLAAILIRERLRRYAAALFVKTVVPEGEARDGDDVETVVYDEEREGRDDRERRETVEAGKALGGRTAELAVLLEKIWNTGFCSHEEALSPSPNSTAPNAVAQDEDINCEDEHDLASTDEREIRSLLSATLIYKSIFPSSLAACGPTISVILSPPPSPSRKNLGLHTALKAALDSRAFELEGGDEELSVALDAARDRVTDMLAELEKPGRRHGRY